MSTVTSYEIKEALAKKHRGEFFLTECKNGPTGVATGQLLQFDAVAIYKSWTNPQIRGYEVKVSRSDFLRDAKYPRYLPYFHEFYFVTPQGMVKREEIDEGIGLMWYNPETGTITTKKKAIYRHIEIDAAFLLYIIMSRLDSDRAPFMLHKEEAFAAWLKGKQSNRELSYRVKSKLLEDNTRLESELRSLNYCKEQAEELKQIREVMAKYGIKSYWNTAEALDAALSTRHTPALDEVREAAQRTVAAIDRLIFKAEKEVENSGRDHEGDPAAEL